MWASAHWIMNMSTTEKTTKSPPTPATSPAPPARSRYVIAAFILAAFGVLLGGLLNSFVSPPGPVNLPGVSIFAGFYVAAQAIERVIEPFSNRAGGVLDGFGGSAREKRPKKQDLVKHRRDMNHIVRGEIPGSATHAQAHAHALEAADAVAL